MGDVARCFEDLDVYQRARELTNAVYSLTCDGRPHRRHSE